MVASATGERICLLGPPCVHVREASWAIRRASVRRRLSEMATPAGPASRTSQQCGKSMTRSETRVWHVRHPRSYRPRLLGNPAAYGIGRTRFVLWSQDFDRPIIIRNRRADLLLSQRNQRAHALDLLSSFLFKIVSTLTKFSNLILIHSQQPSLSSLASSLPVTSRM